jgi:hypothetical protein
MKKKIMAPILITALMLTNVPVMAANFSDINNVPWDGAKTYINDVADKGIMVGSVENGKQVFKARDNLTYSEAAQICYTILKSTNKLDSSSDYVKKWEAVMAGYNIPAWAYTSVSYCLEKSIVSISDLALFMNGSKNNYATRENVSKFMGKAFSNLGYKGDASKVSLKDLSSVTAEALPYVETIAGLGIIVGDENQNFNPKKLITRAEMAVVCSKSYNTLSGGSSSNNNNNNNSNEVTAYGTVVSNEKYNDNYIITLRTSTGDVMSFLTSSSTPMTYKDKSVKNDYPGKEDVVEFVYSGTTLKSLTVVTDADGGYSSFQNGVIDSITATKVKLENSNTYYTFAPSSVTVSLDGSGSTISKIMSACENYTVTARLLLDSNNYVIEIQATRDTSQVYGAIELVNKTRIKIDGTTYMYADVDDIPVKIDGTTRTVEKLISTVDDYDESNKKVYATISLDKDGDVTRIVAVTRDEKANSGKIVSISESRIKIGSTTSYLADEKDLTVKIDGSTRTLDRLISICKTDDEVTAKLTFDDDDYVIRIDATTSDSDDTYEGTLKSITKSTIKVGSKTYSYSEDEELIVKIDGTSVTLNKLISRAKDEEFTVKLTLDSYGDVMKIIATSVENNDNTDVSGEIKSATNSTLKIGSKSYDVKDPDDVDVSVTDGNNTISSYKELREAVNDGKIMSVDVTIKKGYVSEVSGDVTAIEDADITDVYPDSDRIRVSLSSGKYTYEVKGSADITLDGKDTNLTKLKNRMSTDDLYGYITFRTGKITSIEARTK